MLLSRNRVEVNQHTNPNLAMQRRSWEFIIGFALSLCVGVMPVQAQLSNAQVNALVEALRQAAPQTGRENDGLYSDWQVKADNIPRWSKSCIGKEVTPQQFEASPTTARGVVTCIMRDVLRDEYRASGNNETIAVQRSAAWWMTGDPNRYNRSELQPYIQQVVRFYQQNQAKTKPTTASRPTPPQPAKTTSTPYDRYMQTGYEAVKQKNYQTALTYFKRALDERPNDSYATDAIRNTEKYLKENPTSTKPANPSARP
jgi:TolA-binding protein